MNPDIAFFGIWSGEHLPDPEVERRFRWLIYHLSATESPGGKQLCPWAVAAIQEQRFYIGDARNNAADLAVIGSIVQTMCERYRTYDTFRPPNKHPATLTVLIPDAVAGHVIVSVLEEYRRKLTPLGLMLGALDPVNNLRSLTGRKGCPYVAPWNFLTVRWMVRGDSIFLNLNPEYKTIYSGFFPAQ